MIPHLVAAATVVVWAALTAIAVRYIISLAEH